ncbi:hypothetical protein ARMGADRAFT_1166480 [Armillaria gallica]|uniref:Uncharacterized protein n=1 Tax=Armillaria gallica TaxID=47427 RepID=A0A2H3DJM0_ARMGA|nr:hypothetical protein ARMGADRAFT_1166480 [Armillaria gallica]
MEQKYSVVLCGTWQHEVQVPTSPNSTRRCSNSVMLRVREQYVPVASERVSLLSSVADIEREILNDVLPEITRLEDVMAVVTASLDRQNKRKEALKHQIAAQKSLLFSPIRILPAEILSLIFSYTCCSFEGKPKDMQTLCRGMDRDALNISRTCIFWRNICLSMPTLWTSISINLDTIDRAACPALPIYLARSAKKHLYVNIQHTHPPSDSTEFRDYNTICSMVLPLLVQQNFRFHALKIFGSDPFCLEDRFHLYNLITLGLYNLERIRRHYDFAWLNSADNLRTVELVHYSSLNGIQCLKDKFYKNVNELSIREHSPVTAMWTISKFPCITDLDLEIEDGHCSSLRSILTNGMTDLVLPKLDCLDITSDTYGCSNEDPITQFLLKITAPCLTSLGLFCSDDNTWSHADFVDFITRSGIQSRLLQLQLRGPAFGEHELIDTLTTLTGLINLEIWPNSSSLTENLLSRLAFRPQETAFLPSLKGLSLSIDHVLSRPEMIVETIASRVRIPRTSSIKRLRIFDLEYHSCINDGVLSQVRELQSEILSGGIKKLCDARSSCCICEGAQDDD